MAILYDGQVKMANLAIVAGYSVNGVARLHTEILKKEQLKDFYEMMPEKFNNKTNGITQRRFLAHANPLLADWVTAHVGEGWITDLSQIRKLAPYADDKKAQQEFLEIKHQNKVRLAKYIKEHNGIDVDPDSIFDVQVKRLHEYKRQLLNILHVMYLYNEIKEHPDMEFVPRTFIFGAKAAAGYKNAKLTIKLINSVAEVINNDKSINNKIKVVFIEDYKVSNAEWIFAAADVSEQISTASKEASGTGNMKFMLNGAATIGTMDGANVEMAEEVELGYPVNIALGQLPDRTGDGAAGVVDENVDPPIAVMHVLRKGLNGSVVAQIERKADCGIALAAERLRKFLAFIAAAGGDDDSRAHFTKSLRDRRAVQAASAGHDGNLPVETEQFLCSFHNEFLHN